MKKYLFGIMAAVMAACIVGCESRPTPDSMTATSRSIGAAAALVANQSKIDDKSRNAVIDIIKKVEVCIPQTNETFETAWTPIAESHIAQLKSNKTINDGQAMLISCAFSTAVKGIDYLFSVRYPEAREYQELVEAATHGFCDGFLTYFKPATVGFAVGAKAEYDEDAYKYLTDAKLSK